MWICPYLCFYSFQLCSQQLQIPLQALDLEIPVGQKKKNTDCLNVPAQTKCWAQIICWTITGYGRNNIRPTCHQSLHSEVQTPDQICPFADKRVKKVNEWINKVYVCHDTCVNLWLFWHTCGWACMLDVETSLTSMRGSGSSSSSSCCSGSSSSGMTTTGFTCLASEAACRKLGGDWRGDGQKGRYGLNSSLKKNGYLWSCFKKTFKHCEKLVKISQYSQFVDKLYQQQY